MITGLDYRDLLRSLRRKAIFKDYIHDSMHIAFLMLCKRQARGRPVENKMAFLHFTAYCHHLKEWRRRKKYACRGLLPGVPSGYADSVAEESYIDSISGAVPSPYREPLRFMLRHYINRRSGSQCKFFTPETIRCTLRDVGVFKNTRHYAKWIFVYLSEFFRYEIREAQPDV